jgi:hypothetical protein
VLRARPPDSSVFEAPKATPLRRPSDSLPARHPRAAVAPAHRPARRVAKLRHARRGGRHGLSELFPSGRSGTLVGRRIRERSSFFIRVVPVALDTALGRRLDRRMSPEPSASPGRGAGDQPGHGTGGEPPTTILFLIEQERDMLASDQERQVAADGRIAVGLTAAWARRPVLHTPGASPDGGMGGQVGVRGGCVGCRCGGVTAGRGRLPPRVRKMVCDALATDPLHAQGDARSRAARS